MDSSALFLQMFLIILICGCLIVLTILSLCAKNLPELQASVLAYGKLNVSNTRKPAAKWAKLLSTLTVPKHYFNHFYVIGLLFAFLCIIELAYLDTYKQPLFLIQLLQQYDTNEGTQHLSRQQCVIGMTLLTCHLSRRVFESFWIERPSKTATMHISHYLAGVGFYGAMVFGTWLEGLASFRNSQSFQPVTLTDILAVALFLYASYHQNKCHSILADLRKDGQKGYTIPRGDWFEYLASPHYFADILIYFSLCILYRFQNVILVCGLIWTIVNLSIIADETQSWYTNHFKDKYLEAFPKGRHRIIPCCY